MTKPPPPPPRFALKQLPSPHAGERELSWHEVLERAGWPTTCLMLDFETYFDAEYKLKGQGDKGLPTLCYIKDKQYETLGLAHLLVRTPEANHEQDTEFAHGEDMVCTVLKCYQKHFGQNLEQVTCIAHNAPFDMSILLHRYGIKPKWIIDTIALGRAWNTHASHKLGDMCKEFGLVDKGDTAEFKGLSRRKRWQLQGRGKKKCPVQVPATYHVPTWASLASYAKNDVMRQWELFTRLLPKLSNPQAELALQLHTLNLILQPMLRVDFEKGKSIVERMQGRMNEAVAGTGHTEEEISGDKSFEKILRGALWDCDDPERYYKQGKLKKILAIAKDDPERELLEQHSSATVRDLMAARNALGSWPNHIKRVQTIMRIAKAGDGVLPVYLHYHGAHTGRWSGAEKINLQNLGERGEPLISEIREMLIAPEGHTLCIADASQIEARVCAWIAGETGLLEKFERNEELYCPFAEKILGKPVRKIKDENDPDYAWNKWARNAIGKIPFLGCQYGLGTARIQEITGVEEETALKIRDTFRADNPAIVRFWKDLEAAFLYTARYGKPCNLPRGLGMRTLGDSGGVVLVLPSGRTLNYHMVKVVEGTYGETAEVYNAKEHSWHHVWGGFLTENVVQAIARDILAESVLRVEERGKRVVHHVHDEMICCVPTEQGEETLRIQIEELSRRPKWAQGCPLSAEGVVKSRYGGH